MSTTNEAREKPRPTYFTKPLAGYSRTLRLHSNNLFHDTCTGMNQNNIMLRPERERERERDSGKTYATGACRQIITFDRVYGPVLWRSKTLIYLAKTQHFCEKGREFFDGSIAS